MILLVGCQQKTENNEQLNLLNNQSKQCIVIMNKAEVLKNAAIAKNNEFEMRAHQKTIDSAARENVKIGQQIMAISSK